MKIRSSLALQILAAILFLTGAISVNAQDDSIRLQMIGVDTSHFPEVRITLRTADEQSAPVSDFSQLTLHENGTPVTDVTFQTVPIGIDITFVLDANVGFDEVDNEAEGSRREVVQASIRRFATNYMNQDGLDRVSIVVPAEDGQGGSFLIQDATSPEEVIAAIDGYDPAPLRPTPLNAMLTQALEQMQQRDESDRFGGLLLFSDGRRLPEQLSYPLLTALANDSDTPIYTAVLGAEADEQEIANMERLFGPTQATYIHLADPEGSDPIYDIWQQQGDLIQLSYRSRQRQNGRSQVNVNIGLAFASGEFDLSFQAPEIISKEDSLRIRRAGTTADAALADLQPTSQVIEARVFWPDGQPRALSEVTLTLNDQPQTIVTSLTDQPVDALSVEWDISALEAGDYNLVLAVTDELGYQGRSSLIPVQVSFDRPSAPLTESSAVGEQAGETSAAEEVQAVPEKNNSWLTGDVAAGFAVLLLLLGLAVFWRRRDHQGDEYVEDSAAFSPAPNGAAVSAHETELVARLEPFEGSGLEGADFVGENITIGRTADVADIAIDHPSLSHLHARIRHKEGSYWLFDEGGAEGTHLNYERLGLAPRALKSGDVIQFGTASYYFRLLNEDETAAADDREQERQEPVVILDMDGLLIDTEPLSRQAWDQTLADLGHEPLDEAFYRTLLGHRLRETAEIIAAHLDLDIEPSELAWRKEANFAEIRKGGIPVLPGAYELLSILDQRSIRWGIATSTPRHIAEEVLDQVGLLASCQVLAAGDEVENGKPDPDVYLLAAQRLNTPAANCLAVEDSAAGCRAAHAAGMMTIVVPDSHARIDDFECASYILTSLLDVVGRLDDLLEELRQ